MKIYKFLFPALILVLAACVSQPKSTPQNPQASLSIHLGQDEVLPVPKAVNPGFILDSESKHVLLMGELAPNSHLKLKDQTVMMTRISMQTAAAPESGYLNIDPAHMGKWAIVQGYWGGDLYRAALMCVMDSKPSAKVLRQLSTGTTSLKELCK